MSVKDIGPGIPEEEIPIVLASFGQGSNSIKTAEQGAGLGLPIAKSLIDLHGGSFTLKSKLRIGTEIIVAFPPERVMAVLAPIAQDTPRIRSQTPTVQPSSSSDDAVFRPKMGRVRHERLKIIKSKSVLRALVQLGQQGNCGDCVLVSCVYGAYRFREANGA